MTLWKTLSDDVGNNLAPAESKTTDFVYSTSLHRQSTIDEFSLEANYEWDVLKATLTHAWTKTVLNVPSHSMTRDENGIAILVPIDRATTVKGDVTTKTMRDRRVYSKKTEE